MEYFKNDRVQQITCEKRISKKNTMWNIVLVLTFSFCYIIYTGTPIASPFVMSYDITTDNNSRALRHNKRIKTSDKNMKQARKTLLPQMCKYANQAEAKSRIDFISLIRGSQHVFV